MAFSPVLILHIFAGISGLLSGTAAMFFHKGSARHRLTGNVFFVSMLTLGASAAYLAFRNNDVGNLTGGIFTIYLVGTAWITARRSEGETGIVDWVGLVAAIGGSAILFYFGSIAWGYPRHMRAGVPAAMTFFMATIALLCAAGDTRMLMRGGIFGTARIARHLWRMCFGLFIASGSFFIARQRIFPAFIRNAGIPYVLTVLPLLLLIFWMIRIRVTRQYERRAVAARG